MATRPHNFNPRSPRGERHRLALFYLPRGVISIHAPLAGSDGITIGFIRVDPYFNPRSPRGERPRTWSRRALWTVISIHAPLAGSDGFPPHWTDLNASFQSTLPSRGATWTTSIRNATRYFNPRSPRGERPGSMEKVTIYMISIHAPLAGSDSIPM